LLQREARDLVDEYSRCESGDECVVFQFSDPPSLESSCVPAFGCSEALNAGRDLDEFTQQATDISERWSRYCNVCVASSCIGMASASCNEETGFCQSSGADARIEIWPAILEFGQVAAGSSLAIPLTISSVGEDTLYVEDVVLNGAGGFGMELESMERILAPDEETQLIVFCQPQGEGELTGELWILTNDRDAPEKSVPLRCSPVESE